MARMLEGTRPQDVDVKTGLTQIAKVGDVYSGGSYYASSGRWSKASALGDLQKYLDHE